MKTTVKILFITILSVIFFISSLIARRATEPLKKEVNADLLMKDSAKEIIYEMVEEMPQPPGGQMGFAKYIDGHIVYPEGARKAHAQGVVYVSLVIGKDGSVSDVKIKRDPIGYGCGEEAMKIIKAMPPWKPGKMSGRAVTCRCTVPVKFVLQ